MIYVSFLMLFALTAAVEGAAMSLWFLRRDYVYYSLLCNLMTNPAMNLALLILAGQAGLPYWPVVAVLETAVFAAEAWVYRLLCDFTIKRALVVSLVLNGLSFGAGLLVQLCGKNIM